MGRGRGKDPLGRPEAVRGGLLHLDQVLWLLTFKDQWTDFLQFGFQVLSRLLSGLSSLALGVQQWGLRLLSACQV